MINKGNYGKILTCVSNLNSQANLSSIGKFTREGRKDMMNKKLTVSIITVLLLCIVLTAGILLGRRKENKDFSGTDFLQSDQGGIENSSDGSAKKEKEHIFIDPEGNTLETRVLVPEGYERTKAKKDSLTSFLRGYQLKKDGSPVLYYNGKKKRNQTVHAAVFQLPMEEADLQQCADSVMRVYAEYYWHTDQYDKIAFHFVNGFLAEYSKWRQGYRIQVSGNDTSWVKSASPDHSYQSLQEYLKIVFAYASTLSMEKESKKIPLADIRTGDIFIKGGSPGHVVMVVDVCKNKEGKKAFLLAQGFMPAQEFHLLKNPAHDGDPWYYQGEVTYPFATAEYTFEKGSLRRPDY